MNLIARTGSNGGYSVGCFLGAEQFHFSDKAGSVQKVYERNASVFMRKK